MASQGGGGALGKKAPIGWRCAADLLRPLVLVQAHPMRRKQSAAGRTQGVAPQKYRGSGEPPPRSPVEGRREAGHGSVGGKDDKGIEP
jgi:hypothetical protein